MHRLSDRARGVIALALAVSLGVGVSTIAIGLLERSAGIPNASTLYIVVVAAVAFLFGIAGAALTALVAIVVYDFLFTEPTYTLTVADPGEWLSLVLLLFVAVIVGQLAALQRRRADVARARERESRALFGVTRSLATRGSLIDALPVILETVTQATGSTAMWIALGPDDAREQVVAQHGAVPFPKGRRSHVVLHGEADGPARWTLVRPPLGPPGQSASRSSRLFRVRITDGGTSIGSLWLERDELAPPDQEASTLLMVTADLLAQALGQDRIEEERRTAEIARRSDAVKTALLESVSHNLRTPLASIRASAGTLMDPDVVLDDVDRRASAASIDAAAARLDRVVGNLLDLSRIEGGGLHTTREAVELEEVVARAVAVASEGWRERRIVLEVADDIVVEGDPVLLEEALANILDNALVHTSPDSLIRVRATIAAETVHLLVEDSAPGVADGDLERIFHKFFRGPTASRGGSGVGLAVVRGFVEAMEGRVYARRSELGGLAVVVELPAAAPVSAAGYDRP